MSLRVANEEILAVRLTKLYTHYGTPVTVSQAVCVSRVPASPLQVSVPAPPFIRFETITNTFDAFGTIALKKDPNPAFR